MRPDTSGLERHSTINRTIRDPRRARITSILATADTPFLPALLLFAAAVSFVHLRLTHVANGNLSFFIQSGSRFASLNKTPANLVTIPGAGYDGQFYYRMALEPWNFARAAFGIRMDNLPYRLQRIGYPFLTWALSFGRAAAVPFTLITVNIAALTFTGYVSGKWAQSLGRHALWGMLPAGYFGLVWSLSRDLTEITSIALLVAGIVAWRNRHFVIAGVSFGGAVLSRETAVIVIAALVVTRLPHIVRSRWKLSREDCAWVIPGFSYAAWQVVVGVRTGKIPALSGGDNLSLPFVGLYQGVSAWFAHPLRNEGLQLTQFFALLIVVGIAYVSLRRTQGSNFERLAFVFMSILALLLSKAVWSNDPREFRTMTELYFLGTGVLLGTPALRLLLVTIMTWGVWITLAIYSIRTG